MDRLRQLAIAKTRSLGALAFASCAWVGFSLLFSASAQVSIPPRPQPQDDRVSRAVVQLLAVGPAKQGENRECSATGFFINEDGYLITNWHVVEAAERCLENAPGAKILAKLTVNDARTASAVSCDLVGVDAANDLALLKAERPLPARAADKPPYVVLDTRGAPVGSTVKVTGYPALSWQPITQTGRVVWLGRTRLEGLGDPLPGPSDALMVDIRLRPGNSGSPVYLPNGGVIAIVDKRDSLRPEYSIAVAIHCAIELAERYGARWRQAD
jgi:serine protease DegQ